MNETPLDRAMRDFKRRERAAAAYVKTFEGEWGIKASSEDALLSVLVELYPDEWPKSSADTIYALRADEELSPLSEYLYDELESQGLEPMQIANALVPRIDAVMQPRRDMNLQDMTYLPEDEVS